MCATSFLDHTSAHGTYKCVFEEPYWHWENRRQALLPNGPETSSLPQWKAPTDKMSTNTLYPHRMKTPPPNLGNPLSFARGTMGPGRTTTTDAQTQKHSSSPRAGLPSTNVHIRQLDSQQMVDSTMISRHSLGVILSARLNVRLLFPP